MLSEVAMNTHRLAQSVVAISFLCVGGLVAVLLQDDIAAVAAVPVISSDTAADDAEPFGRDDYTPERPAVEYFERDSRAQVDAVLLLLSHYYLDDTDWQDYDAAFRALQALADLDPERAVDWVLGLGVNAETEQLQARFLSYVQAAKLLDIGTVLPRLSANDFSEQLVADYAAHLAEGELDAAWIWSSQLQSVRFKEMAKLAIYEVALMQAPSLTMSHIAIDSDLTEPVAQHLLQQSARQLLLQQPSYPAVIAGLPQPLRPYVAFAVASSLREIDGMPVFEWIQQQPQGPVLQQAIRGYLHADTGSYRERLILSQQLSSAQQRRVQTADIWSEWWSVDRASAKHWLTQHPKLKGELAAVMSE